MGLAGEHLGRGVQRGERLRGGRDLRGVHDSGHAEVGDGELAVPRDEDVLRLDVAVQHSGLVYGGQRAGEFDARTQHLGHRQRPLLADLVAQGAVLEEVHRDVRLARARHARVEDGDHVRMPGEAAGELQLALEPAHRALVDPVDGQHLERHDAVEALLVGAVHDGESALTRLIEYPVPRGVLDWQHVISPCCCGV